MIRAIFNWFLTVTGSNNTSGTYYGFWSGFGSDIGEFALLGVIFKGLNTMIKHHHERQNINQAILNELKESNNAN
jgi:hypothetical protein